MGNFDGILRQRGGGLPLFLFRCTGGRPHRAGRHICAWLSAYCRSVGLWHTAAAKEDTARRLAHMAGARMTADTFQILADYIESAHAGAVLKKELALDEMVFTVRRESLRR